MAAIPRSAVDEAVLTQQLSVQRYATALLVRLRRLLRTGDAGETASDDLDALRRGRRRMSSPRPTRRRPNRPARRRPQTIPDRSLEPDGPAAGRRDPRAGHAPVRLPQDGRSASVGPLVANPGRPRPGRRPRRPAAGLRPLEPAVADQPAAALARARAARDRVLGPADRPGGDLASEHARPRRSETNAYRVVHAEGDGLSGLIVDRFDDVLSVEVFSLGMYQRIGPILDLFAGRLGTRHFRVHVDERIALQEDFPGRPLASPELPPRVTIPEHGVRYRIHFEEGHKTGFFCDQRDNRRDLAKFCDDRTVLDACCYTGGFGLNALIRGKAREVTCVDLDEKAVALAKENGNANSVRLDVGPRRRLRLHAADGRRTSGLTASSSSTLPS